MSSTEIDRAGVVSGRMVETARLVMRPHEADDFGDCLRLWSDPEVTRFIGGRAFTEEEIWARFLRYVGHWAMLGYGYWVVRERTTGRFVGEVGLANYRRDMTPALGEVPEVGWVLAADAAGRGVATEAIRGALVWADMRLAAPRTVCIIDPGHALSLRVAEKTGYRHRGRASYKGGEILVLERPAVATGDT